MWGGTPDRNMVSSMKGLPTTWDVKTKKNVKWVAELGSQAYGNPVVANGVVLVGTNNEAMQDPNVKGDKGILMAFRESDGQFLWQAVHDKLAAGRANDWPYQGVCSSPLVENGIAYYVSNRGELMAVDIDGFRDGKNDGLVKDEKPTRETDVDIIWRYDMMEELGVLQHNMANSSPVMFENLIFVSTSNGQDESHVNVPSPKAPAIIAVDKTTGKLVWEDNSVGEKILHGQWSSPAVGKVGDAVQVVIGQGDGWVRGYEAKTGKKLWEFDLNPKDSVWPKTRNEVISTPVILRERRLHRQRAGPGAWRRGRPPLRHRCHQARRHHQDRRLWHYDKIRRSISTGALYNGILFYSDFSGFLHALDAKTGKPFWTHDMFAAIWGSPMVIDGKVYLGDEDGDVTILAADRTLKVIAENNMGSSVYSTPVPANGTLYVVNRNQLFALAEAQIDANNSVQIHSPCALLTFSCLSSVSLVAQAPPVAARRSLAAIPRHLRADRHDGGRAAGLAQAAVDLRRRRRDRVLGGHCRRRRSTSVRAPASCTRSIWPTARASGNTRPPPTGSASRRRRSPAGSSTSAISPESLHAVDAASGKAAWTFKTGGEMKSSPVVAGDRGPDRLVRLASLRARRQGRQAALEGPDRRLRPRHPRRRRWRGLRAGMRRDPARDPRSPTARRC